MKTLKPLSIVFMLLFSSTFVFGQDDKEKGNKEAFAFTDVKILPHTSVKNQASSGTCWSFSGIGMLECEIIRIKGDSINLSPMWVVRNIYKEKVAKYVRLHGSLNLSAGGSFADVLQASSKYGIVPAEVYEGLNYGTTSHSHSELDRIVEEFGKNIVKSRKPTTAWPRALSAILDAYLGDAPEKFVYNSKEYTPESFVKYTGLKLDDYVSITSYTHHPFYGSFILEIPDNWIWESSYNVPMDELIQIIDNSIEKGYAVAWGSDVSERSFSRDVATIPEEKKVEEAGSDQARWDKESAEPESKPIVEPLPNEKTITQQMRQEAFDNYETTDDHGMVIIGTAKDQNEKKYYKVKNSWGTGGKYAGFLYASLPFVQYKTMNIVVHKDAIPQNIKTKLNLK